MPNVTFSSPQMKKDVTLAARKPQKPLEIPRFKMALKMR